MPESVVEIVRVCIGFFLVIFGYIASIKERYLGMPLIGAREQPTGIINGFVATLGGVLLISTSVQRFFLLGLPLILISVILQTIVLAHLKKKAKHFIGKEGKAATDMKRKHNGFADFNGKKTKVYAEMDIQVGEMVYVSDVEGNIIKVKKLK